MTIHRCRLTKSSKGGHFVNLPNYAEYDPAGNKVMKDGKPVYHPYIEFSDEKKKEFMAKVLEELKPFVGISS